MQKNCSSRAFQIMINYLIANFLSFPFFFAMPGNMFIVPSRPIYSYIHEHLTQFNLIIALKNAVRYKTKKIVSRANMYFASKKSIR